MNQWDIDWNHKNDAAKYGVKNKGYLGKRGKLFVFFWRLFRFAVNAIIILTSPIWVFPAIIFGLLSDQDEWGVFWGDKQIFIGDSINKKLIEEKKGVLNEYAYTLSKMTEFSENHALQYNYFYVRESRKYE